MKTEEIHLATINKEHIGMLSNYVLQSWPAKKQKFTEKYNYSDLSEMKQQS